MKILFLNSAHSKYPIGSDPWVQATVYAIKKFAEKNNTVVCSTEPSPWSLTTYLAGTLGLNIELIVRHSENGEGKKAFNDILENYNFDCSRTQPHFIQQLSGKKLTEKATWQIRDRVALELADVIYPISVRPGGRLDKLLQDNKIEPKVNNDFRIEWSRGGDRPSYRFKNRIINSLHGDWLIHWTCASPGPWPGEKSWQFYRDLLTNPDTYVRSAGATLARIVNEECVRGSSWKISGDDPAVAFTAQSIAEALPLMRWRKRFVRYTFEPYGIAVKKSALIDFGAREVSYEQIELSDNKPDKLFIHAPGEITDWSLEKEWRVPGDLPFDKINKHDMIVIVPEKRDRNIYFQRVKQDIPVHVIFGE
ncbi:MAG: hypothetical protein JXB48_17245 [Candidatus Latescibacteria bacterium]|nr:hypothetical protein [Candidatus Latescibacterota bacterium]